MSLVPQALSLALRNVKFVPGGAAMTRQIVSSYLFNRSRRNRGGYAARAAKILGPTARKYGARIIQRAWRGYSNRRKQGARKRIGMPVGTSTARHTQVGQVLPVTAQGNRELYSKEITAIEQGVEPNERNRDILNFRGVKICCLFRNTANDSCLFLNYAVISPKIANNVGLQGFFRSNANQRAVDFDDTANLTSMDYHCRNINSDLYNIITHKRLKLAARQATTQNVGGYTARVMRYIPIKRQLRYDQIGELGEKCTTPIFFIWWYDIEGLGVGVSPNSYDYLMTDLRLITYFRNPPN